MMRLNHHPEQLPEPEGLSGRTPTNPADYLDALLRSQNHDIPTVDECQVILDHLVSLPEKVVRHCRKVEQVARRICRTLQTTGATLNLSLVSAASLLHDVAKGKKDHAGRGARMLSEMGFPRVGHIVSQHTDLCVIPDTKINEAEIVYMADKLAVENHSVPLAQRFEEALEKYGQDPEARRAVMRRKETTLALKDKLEQALGVSVESLL